jgi:hypothetical protein
MEGLFKCIFGCHSNINNFYAVLAVLLGTIGFCLKIKMKPLGGIILMDLNTLKGNQISLQIGKELINGLLVDAGEDILVLYNGKSYLYISLLHVRQFQLNSNKDDYVDLPSDSALIEETTSLTTQEVLNKAKGTFTEIYIGSHLSYNGYIINVLNDYVAFYSPVYKVVYIPIQHIKWIIPDFSNQTPYSLNSLSLTHSKSPLHLKVNANNIPLVPLLENQLKKEAGKLVIFDGGMDPQKVGLLKKVENQLAEILLAKGESLCLRLSHIKSVQMP